jgi:hypothetical protein
MPSTETAISTLDKWTSEAEFIACLDRFSDEYRALDERLEDLSLTESRIGAFNDEVSVGCGENAAIR